MDFGAIFFPTLLICGLFGIILLVGIGFSYVWLLILDKQLRKCPRCHKKGAGYIAETITLHTENHMDYKQKPPARVTVKTYEDQYICQKCGHTWLKTGKETTRLPIRR